jgi:uncharacterized protein
MATMKQVSGFMQRKRLAVVGVSRNPRDFTRTLFREFVRRGYDAVPVHPGVSEMEGRPCFSTVREIGPPVEAAVLLTSPEVTDHVVRDCAEAGISSVWMYRATGAGAVSRQAVAFCESNHIDVVAGECPLMFFPNTGLLHRAHACIRQLTGRYPK